MATEYPLSLVVRAVDKATGPLKRITERLNVANAPIREFSKTWKGFAEAANLGGLSKSLSGFGGALKNVAGETVALGAKLLGIASAAGFALFTVVRGAVDAGDKLGEMAARVGVGVDVYASLGFAAAQADVDQEQFNTSLDQFNKRLGEAKAGGGGLLEFLKKVSPRLGEQVKNAKSTEAALSLMTDAFARIDDPGKRAALAAAAFGKSGLQMGNFLHQGSKAIQEQQRRYLELAGSQEAFAAGAGDLDNALRESETAFLGLRSAIGGALFPALTKLAGLVTAFVVKNRDGIKLWAEGAARAIQAWIDGGGFQRLVDGFSRVASGIGWVLDKLGPMGTVAAGAGALALPLIGALGSLAAAAVSVGVNLIPLLSMFPGLGAGILAALGPIGAFLLAVGGVIAAGKAIYDNWADLKFIFTNWGIEIKFAVQDAWNAVKPIFDKISTVLNPRFGFGDKPGALPPGFDPVAALPQSARSSQTEARVSVDFSNLPRGARVSTEPNSSQPVNLSAGYSMVTQ